MGQTQGAEEGSLTLIGSFRETYLVNPKVSGSLLVGLQGTRGDGRFDPADVEVTVPEISGPSKACVSISTKDGRYSAENLYLVPSGSERRRRVPVSTQFGKQLQAYRVDDVAVLARLAPSCEDPGAGVLLLGLVDPPERDAASPGNHSFEVLVNADPARATAEVDGLEGTRASCVAPRSGVNVSFSARCQIKYSATAASGRYVLVLTIRERFSAVATRFDMVLAR